MISLLPAFLSLNYCGFASIAALGLVLVAKAPSLIGGMNVI